MENLYSRTQNKWMDGKLKLGELKTQANKRKLYLLLCCWQIMQACKQKCRGRGQSLHSANLTAQTPLDFLNTLPNFIQFVSLICLLHGAEWGNWCDCFLTAAIFGQCYLDWAYKEYSQHYIVFIMMLRFGPFINSVGYHHTRSQQTANSSMDNWLEWPLEVHRKYTRKANVCEKDEIR